MEAVLVLVQKMGNLTESESDDDRRRSPKKLVGRKRIERRRVVSTSSGRGPRPGRVAGPEPITPPVTPNPKVNEACVRVSIHFVN